MNYALSDPHNDNDKFCRMLERISFDKDKDRLFIVGDLFDRANYNPDPVGIYFSALALGNSLTFIRGNHDSWLAKYIYEYYGMAEKKRNKLHGYFYNSFELLSKRLVERDMITLADWIMAAPVQIPEEIDGRRYLFAHAMTSAPDNMMEEDYYLMGGELGFPYWKNGIEGYISLCGHTPTDIVRMWYGDEYKQSKLEIWSNPKGNVYMLDCGCGLYYSGRLGCLCIETGETFYVP